MPVITTPSLGAKVGEVYNSTTGQIAKSAPVGTKFSYDDGHDYVMATASGAVAAGATVILTEPALTFATGAGAFTYPGTVALVSGDKTLLRKTAI
jgi:hypothetical protein